MEFIKGNKYNGFILTRVEFVEEIDSLTREFEHEKTGTKLIQLANNDENKSFGVMFNTIPEDNTGVAHILEHSVLCGSKNFNVKSPFTELMKGSLKTFVNAMTGSHLTYYPFSSKNEKDFMNIMHIYLDAVFNPLIYTKKETLMQEGWHYELDSKDGELTYKGVVYNEMRGVYSSAGTTFTNDIDKALFDNCYQYDSGGNPDFITDLTQEQFENFHKKYYHPSNALMYLYGDANLLNVLQFINDNYLVNYDKVEKTTKIPLTTPLNEMKEIVSEYSITQSDNEKEKAAFSLAFVTNETKDLETSIALKIIASMLSSNQETPIYKALVESGLCKFAMASYDDSRLQGIFKIDAIETDATKKDEFKNIVFKVLNKIVKDGISREDKEATFNKFEFNLKEPAEEAVYSRPIAYMFKISTSWIQEVDLLDGLKYGKVLKSLREKIDTNYFEDLIQKYILDNKHAVLAVQVPVKDLNVKQNEELKQKLQKYKESLTNEQLQHIIDNTKYLKEYQQRPDIKQELDKIPTLTRDDLDSNIKMDKVIEKDFNGIKLLHTDINTKGIVHAALMFDLKEFEEEELKYIEFMSRFITQLSTKNYTVEKLTNAKKNLLGSCLFQNEIFNNINNDKFEMFHSIKFSCLPENMESAVELIKEMLINVDFENNKPYIKQMVELLYQFVDSNMKSDGQLFAKKLLASFLPHAKCEESIKGLEFHNLMKELRENFDEKIDALIKKIYGIKQKLYNKNLLTLVVGGKENEVQAFNDNIQVLIDCCNDNKVQKVEYNFIEKPIKEAIINSSKVNYVYQGYNFKKLGYNTAGSLSVLQTILDSEYLWDLVRVQGGAYGVSCMIGLEGTIVFGSYRDPNISKTLDAYNSVINFVENFSATEEQMLKYIIGTIAQPVSYSTVAKISKAITQYYGNVSYDTLQNHRKQILETTAEDIRSLKPLIEDVLNKKFYIVVGSEEKINEIKESFDEITKLN